MPDSYEPAADGLSTAPLEEARLTNGAQSLDPEPLETILANLQREAESASWFERFLDWLAQTFGDGDTLDLEVIRTLIDWLDTHSDIVMFFLLGSLILAAFLVVWLFAAHLRLPARSVRRSDRDLRNDDDDTALEPRAEARTTPLIAAYHQLLGEFERRGWVSGVTTLTAREIAERLSAHGDGPVARGFISLFPRMDRFLYDRTASAGPDPRLEGRLLQEVMSLNTKVAQ